MDGDEPRRGAVDLEGSVCCLWGGFPETEQRVCNVGTDMAVVVLFAAAAGQCATSLMW